MASILVEEGCKMILQSVDQLIDKIPQKLKELKDELSTMGEPCRSDLEKKSYFDKLSHKMTPRIQQLLNGSSNADETEKLLLNSNIQNFLKTFEEKFSKGADMIFTGDFKRQIEKNLGEEQITNVMIVIFQVHGTIHLVKTIPTRKNALKTP